MQANKLTNKQMLLDMRLLLNTDAQVIAQHKHARAHTHVFIHMRRLTQIYNYIHIQTFSYLREMHCANNDLAT